MAKFSVNTQRYDPYRNFKFRVKWQRNGQWEYVAGLSKIGALKKTTEAIEWREAGDPSTGHQIPGKTKYEAITLEAGLTHDLAFEEWANLVNNFQGDASMSLKNFRKDLIIEVYNMQDKAAMAYNVYRCWVSEYQALPELDAGANAIAIRTITIQNEGWDRDTAVTEPTET